jgi:hypothetical protein
MAGEPRVLVDPPEELTRGRLIRLGEGIGKVVYASPHWVVKRERTPFEIVGLIVVWKFLRKIERLLPGSMGKRLLEKPSRQIRFLRVVAQAGMAVVPRAIWFSSHIKRVWRQYHLRSARGERLAREHLQGSSLIPEEITFPSIKVNVGGWPGALTVSCATERVETTFHDKLRRLAAQGQFDEIELWLVRLLATRQKGWSMGLFSLDSHFKNFGIVEDRVVLIDVGGLTNRWNDVEAKLALEESLRDEPHQRLGLGKLLESRPEIAARFNARWRGMVNREAIREIWPKHLRQLEPPPH